MHSRTRPARPRRDFRADHPADAIPPEKYLGYHTPPPARQVPYLNFLLKMRKGRIRESCKQVPRRTGGDREGRALSRPSGGCRVSPVAREGGRVSPRAAWERRKCRLLTFTRTHSKPSRDGAPAFSSVSLHVKDNDCPACPVCPVCLVCPFPSRLCASA